MIRDGKAGGGAGGENEVESTSPGSGEMPLERIVEAENIAENGLNRDMMGGANGNQDGSPVSQSVSHTI